VKPQMTEIGPKVEQLRSGTEVAGLVYGKKPALLHGCNAVPSRVVERRHGLRTVSGENE